MQRLNHHHLYVFYVFTKHLSFTKTAEELLIAQSAVTSQVRMLEESLDVELVNRTNPRRPDLTEAGLKVAEYADSIFEASRQLLNWASHGALPHKRILRLGAISGLSRNFQYEFIEPLLKNSDFKFEFMTADQPTLLKLLAEHQLDVVLTSQNANSDSKASFHSHVLNSTPLVAVTCRKPRFKKEVVDFLNDQEFVYIPGRFFESKPELDAFLQDFKNLKIKGEIDDTALLRILAIRSGNVVVIPEMGVRNEIKNKEVFVIGRVGKIQQKYYAITRQRKEPNGDVRFLIDTIQKKRI